MGRHWLRRWNSLTRAKQPEVGPTGGPSQAIRAAVLKARVTTLRVSRRAKATRMSAGLRMRADYQGSSRCVNYSVGAISPRGRGCGLAATASMEDASDAVVRGHRHPTCGPRRAPIVERHWHARCIFVHAHGLELSRLFPCGLLAIMFTNCSLHEHANLHASASEIPGGDACGACARLRRSSARRPNRKRRGLGRDFNPAHPTIWEHHDAHHRRARHAARLPVG